MRLSCLKNTYHSFLCASLIFCDFFFATKARIASRNQHPLEIPFTRLKGEIVCFSCFSNNNALSKGNAAESQQRSAHNLTEIVNIFQVSGMKVPNFAHRCADTLAHANPNFLGANVHICPNNLTEPGSCIKFKGIVHGEWYVYRECWSKMWINPRPFWHDRLDGCYDDQFVQSSFIGFNRSTICVCEGDLCNVASHHSLSLPLILMYIIYDIIQ